MESLSNHMSSLGTFDVRRVAQLSVPHVRVNCPVVAVVHVDVAHNLLLYKFFCINHVFYDVALRPLRLPHGVARRGRALRLPCRDARYA